MASPGSAFAIPLAGLLLLSGCGFHMVQVEVRRPFSRTDFEAIEVGRDHREELLARLGPPDRLSYSLRDEIHEYDTGRHRGTDLRFFVPSDLVRVPGLGAVAGILNFFFAPFEEPDDFRETFQVSASRAVIGTVAGLVPFGSGQSVLTLRGRQLRTDRILVAVDRETLRVKRKALLLATEDLAQQSTFERALLRTD
jgi:hypothetical protein